MFDFLFHTPKYTVCRIALSDNLNMNTENKVISELLVYLNYSVTIVDKCKLIDEYHSMFETTMSSMTSPMLEYIDSAGIKGLFSGFYPIIRFLGRLTHLFPSDIGNAAQIDTIVDFHSVFMNLYFNNPASTTLAMKNLMSDIDEKNPYLSSMDSCSIADILWAVTMREINVVSRSHGLLEKIKYYNQNILGESEEYDEDDYDCDDNDDSDDDDSDDDANSDDDACPTL